MKTLAKTFVKTPLKEQIREKDYVINGPLVEITKRIVKELEQYGEVTCERESDCYGVESDTMEISINGERLYLVSVFEDSKLGLGLFSKTFVKIMFNSIYRIHTVWMGRLNEFNEEVLYDVYKDMGDHATLACEMKAALKQYREVMKRYEKHLVFIEDIKERQKG
jgi:hypothetical protein